MSRRVAIVGFALLASLLVVASMPAAAVQTNVAVGSIHDDAAAFNAATTLENMTVSGAGAAAHVNLTTATFADDFDGEAADAGTPDGWTQQSAPTAQNVTTIRSDSGSQSWFVDASGSSGSFNPTSQPIADTTVNASWAMYTLNDGSGSGNRILLWEGGLTGSAVIQLSQRNGDLMFFNATAGAWEDVTTAADEDEWVTVTVFDVDPTTDTFAVEWTAGADSGVARDLHMAGAMTSGYDLIEVNPAGGAISHYDSFAVGEDADRGTYVSQTHSVDNASTAFANISVLTNARAVINVTADTNGDGSFETVAATTEVTTPGNHTLDVSATTSTGWRINTTAINQTTNGAPSFRLDDEGLLFVNHEPRVFNATTSPTGSVTSASPTVTIDANDTEFGTAQGEQLAAELFVDGVSEGSDTLNTNGTASVTAGPLTGGSHTYHWEITDSYGLKNASQTVTISTPANITIRNETEPHAIIKEAGVAILLSGSGETVDKQTIDDGNVSLAGIPADQEYVLVVDAPNYHLRSTYVEDIFNQSDVYLLNESMASVRNTFVIGDNTGNFNDPVFLVQKPLNRSIYDDSFAAEYQWVTVGGDRLGAAAEHTIDLEQDARYRLRIKQGTDERVLGEYTATAGGTVSLEVGQIEWDLPPDQRYNWSFSRTTVGGSDALRFTYNDATDNTTDLQGTIHEVGNESNVLTTFSTAGPVGRFAFTQPLTSAQAETDWAVNYTAARGGETISTGGVTGLRRIGSGVPLFATIQSIDPVWRTAITFTVILGSGFVVGGLFSAIGAMIVVGVAAVLWAVGLSSIGLSLVLLALIAAIGYRLAARGGI